MEFESGQGSKTAVAAFSGDCTLERARELKETFVKAFEASQSVEMDLREVETADLCFFQIICSAHRTAMKTGKRLFPGAGPSRAFVETAGEAGYRRTVGCHGDRDKECLWMEVMK